MTTSTPNLALVLYNSTTDSAEYFSNFRAVIAGTSLSSNFYKIDTAYGNMQAEIDSIQAGAYLALANLISANYYEATVAGISSYTTGMKIILSLNTASAGTVTLNINSLGIKSVMKINSSGTPVNISSGELMVGKYYFFAYDGTRWVWVDATSSDQIYISGTSGNVVRVNTDNTLIGDISPSTLVSTTISSASEKTNPVGTDLIGLPDSEDSFLLKKVQLSNVYKALGTGVQDSTTFLRGDGTYSIPKSGSLTNQLLNGSFENFQRLTIPSTPVSMTDNFYNAPDRWYSLIEGTGATISQTSGIGSSQYSCKIVAGGTTNRYGIAQIIKADKSIPMKDKEVTFQILGKIVNNSGSGTRNYRIAVIEWNGTPDVISATPHDLVLNWASSNYTLGNFFEGTTKTLVGTSSFTLTHNVESLLSFTGNISSSCQNLIVFVWSENAPTHASDYILLGEASVTVSSETVEWNYTDDYIPCLSFCERFSGATGFNFATGLADSTSVGIVTLLYKVRKWRLPLSSEIKYGYSSIGDFTIRYGGGGVTPATIITNGSIGYDGHVIVITGTGTPLVIGQNVNGRYANTNAYIIVETEI